MFDLGRLLKKKTQLNEISERRIMCISRKYCRLAFIQNGNLMYLRYSSTSIKTLIFIQLRTFLHGRTSVLKKLFRSRDPV